MQDTGELRWTLREVRAPDIVALKQRKSPPPSGDGLRRLVYVLRDLFDSREASE